MALLQSAKRHLKYSAIRMGLEAVAHSHAPALFPGSGGRGVIFTLHHVRPEGGSAFRPNAVLSVTPAFLEEAIEAVRESGLTPVHLHELPALLADPSDERRFAAFTLDDGYRNNARFAAPVFRKFAVPYTIFITAGFVERTRLIWWETAEALTAKAPRLTFDFGEGPEEVRMASLSEKLAAFARLEAYVRTADEDEAVERIGEAARACGIDPMAILGDLVMDAAELRALVEEDPFVHLGAHTLTHVNLKRVSSERLQREMAGSAHAVERYVGRKPLSFSYPYGWKAAAGEREMAAARRAGFGVAVTTQPGVLGPACLEQPTGMPRVSLNGLFQKKRYVKALISGLPFRFV